MKKKHPEHVNHERWLVSYADFITLLFAFFVVLFASGQTNKRKEIALAHSMQSAFDHNGIFDPHSATPPIAEDANQVQHAIPSPLSLPLPSLNQPEAPGNVKSIAEHIRDIAKTQPGQGIPGEAIVTVHPSPEGLVISLREAGFFASGSADVRNESQAALRAIAKVLPGQAMRIEGHTDDIPIHTAQFATNWELSTARAATITRYLISVHAAEPARISAAGYAEFRPIADNATEQGRAQNRRVDIVLLKDPVTPPPQAPSQ